MTLNSARNFILNSKCVRLMSTRNLSTVQASLFTNMLGLSPDIAQQYVKKFNLQKLDTIRLADTINFLNSNKYAREDILKNPELFQLCQMKTWEQFYLYLKECGCKNITLGYLLSCRQVRYCKIVDLKQNGILPETINVPQRLYTKLDVDVPNNIIDDLLDENLTLSCVHTTILRRYLSYRLETTEEDIEKLFRIYKNIVHKSITAISENIKLGLELGYTKQKLLRNGYILSSLPRHTKEVLATIPDFVGSDMRVQMKMYPKLFGISLQNILRIYDILKSANISDEMIQKSMNIFTLSPTTIESRLNNIRSVDETRVLMSNPQMLNLIIHYNRAKSRLSFMQQIKLKCTSLCVIGSDDVNKFDDHIKTGRDVNSSRELERFLKVLLKIDEDSEINIRKHPFFLNVPFTEIEKTYYFLKCKSFTIIQIRKTMHILLYPKQKVQKALEDVEKHSYLQQKRLKNSKILNIALYLLEKEYHFTGNGIWTDHVKDKEDT